MNNEIQLILNTTARLIKGTNSCCPRQWRRQRSKEPGHFEVRTSSSQVIRMHFFPQKSLLSFLVVALKTEKPPTPLRLFYCQNETNKVVSGQIW